MAGRRIVHLRIEVPDDVDVVPVIVRKPRLSTPGTGAADLPGAGFPNVRLGPKGLKLDLTTAKAANWLSGPDALNANACCVRGFMG